MLVRGIGEWRALIGKHVSFELFEPWEPDLWTYSGVLEAVTPLDATADPTIPPVRHGDFYAEGDWGGRLILADETVRVTVEGE